MMGARPLLALLFAIHLSKLVSCGCSTRPSDFSDCSDGRYDQPAIRNVIDSGQPTSLAQASDDHGAYLLSIVRPLVSAGVTALVPYGGLVVGGINGILAAMNVPSGEDPYEQILSVIYAELEKLREYVDYRIQEAALDHLNRTLGNKYAGIFGRVHAVNQSETAEERWLELSQLHALLQNTQGYFLPPTSSIMSYEASLPYFRVFGDLFMTCLMDQLQTAKVLEKFDELEGIMEEIVIRAEIFHTHYVKALDDIISEHTDVEDPDITHDVYFAIGGLDPGVKFDLKATIEMGGIACSYEVKQCAHGDAEVEVNKLQQTFNNKKNTFIENRRNDLQNYWHEQVGQVVDKWNDIADAMEVEISNLPTYFFIWALPSLIIPG